VPDKVGYEVLELIKPFPEHTPFSGVEQDFEEIGAAAMTLLHGEITAGRKGLPRVRHRTLISGRWVAGGTTRPHPGDA
jgi:LacI family transcriptional regulator